MGKQPFDDVIQGMDSIDVKSSENDSTARAKIFAFTRCLTQKFEQLWERIECTGAM